jgi:hypothetical protein
MFQELRIFAFVCTYWDVGCLFRLCDIDFGITPLDDNTNRINYLLLIVIITTTTTTTTTTSYLCTYLLITCLLQLSFHLVAVVLTLSSQGLSF